MWILWSSVSVKTPAGLAACEAPLLPRALPAARVGEVVRYLVDVNGLSVGKVDFKTEGTGPYENTQAVEYRSLFNIDSLVATLLPIQGKAASLAHSKDFYPIRAMNTYSVQDHALKETLEFQNKAHVLNVSIEHNRQTRHEKKHSKVPFADALTGFYFLRALPLKAQGCALIYAYHRVYTVWLDYQAMEEIKTPVGYKNAERYGVRWGSDKGKHVFEGHIWMATTSDRLPLYAKTTKPYALEARVGSYVTGKKQ